HIFKLFASLRVESAVIGAGRDQNAFCPEHGAATFDLKTGTIFVSTIIMKCESLRRRGKFCAETISLKLREPGQIATTDSGRETKKVFDQRRGTGLPTGSVTF